MKRLPDLFQDIPDELTETLPGYADQRHYTRFTPGETRNLFFALTGGNVDGHQFIGDAIRRGAVAVVGSRPMTGYSVPCLQVKNARRSLAWISAAFYDHPGRKLVVIGVTGTDGKTTTCNLIHRILLAAGIEGWNDLDCQCGHW